MKKFLVVVPAFNEEKQIGKVLKDLRKHGFFHILVVDDGSHDGTSQKAKMARVKVVRHLVNRGLGAALGTGFEYARAKNFDGLVTFDADGQHLAKDIKRLLGPIKTNTADVVIGSRTSDMAQMPKQRRLINFISNIATFAIYGVWSTDSQSGLRAFNKKALTDISIKTNRMEVSSEFFREIRENRLRYSEIPIKSIYTEETLKNSKQEKYSSILYAYRLIIRLFR